MAKGDTEYGNMHVQEDSDDASLNTPDRPARENLDTVSPNHIRTAPPLVTPRKRMRPLSLDTSNDNHSTLVPSRGSYHNDNDDAKLEDMLEAREAELEARTARLYLDEASLDRCEVQLHDREAEIERLFCQVKAKIDRREAQLHADTAEYCRPLRTAETQPNERREQQASMLQSIKGLRAGFKIRKTSYQNEFMFIASQTNTLEMQVWDLQQSIGALDGERNNATVRYQEFEVLTEAGIQKLVEEVITLFD